MKKDKKISFRLMSGNNLAVSIPLTLLMLILLIAVIFFTTHAPIYAIVFASIIFAAQIFKCAFDIMFGIIVDIDKKTVSIRKFKKTTIKLDDIELLYCDKRNYGVNTEGFIIIKMKNGDVFRLAGYQAVFNKKMSFDETCKIVSAINAIIYADKNNIPDKEDSVTLK